MKRFFIWAFLLFMAIMSFVTVKTEPVFRRTEIKVSISGEVLEECELTLKVGSELKDLLPLLQLTENADLAFFHQKITLKNNDIVIVPPLSQETKISINYGTLAELCRLKGIGPVLAQRIIDYRSENGLFQKLSDITEVKGIKQKIYEKIAADICL